MTIPADLNAQVHQMIVSGEFRAWRRRNPTIYDSDDQGEASSEFRRGLAKCTYPECHLYYQRSPRKTNTYCGKHSRLTAYMQNRERTMTKCAYAGCDRLIRRNGNSTGRCRLHAERNGNAPQRAGRKAGKAWQANDTSAAKPVRASCGSAPKPKRKKPASPTATNIIQP